MKVKLKVNGNKSLILNGLESIREKIASDKLFGELGFSNNYIVNISNVTHKITDIYEYDEDIIVEADVLVTKGYTDYNVISTKADALANLIIAGYKFYATPRYDGSMNVITFDVMQY